MRIFAVSDIHGCFTTFSELLFGRISLQKTDRLFLLGDYIDRGPSSKQVLDLIMNLTAEGYDIVPLMGNHEKMMLDAFRDPDNPYGWFMNGGDTTMKSFGLTDIQAIPGKYILFLESLQYYSISGNYVFVHGSVDPHGEAPFTVTDNMLWVCHDSYPGKFFVGKTVIHGHRPKTTDQTLAMIREKKGTIAIDNGCVYNYNPQLGYLSALEVNSMVLYQVKNME